MEGPISFWGFKEQESNLILPEHDDDDEEVVYDCIMYTWYCILAYIQHNGNVSFENEITNQITPWRRVLLEKLTGSQLVKKFPAFYGTRKFITAFTSARHLSLSWARSTQSIPPHPTSWRSILILSSHIRLGLPSALLASGLPLQYPVHTRLPYVPHALPISFILIWLPV